MTIMSNKNPLPPPRPHDLHVFTLTITFEFHARLKPLGGIWSITIGEVFYRLMCKVLCFLFDEVFFLSFVIASNWQDY